MNILYDTVKGTTLLCTRCNLSRIEHLSAGLTLTPGARETLTAIVHRDSPRGFRLVDWIFMVDVELVPVGLLRVQNLFENVTHGGFLSAKSTRTSTGPAQVPMPRGVSVQRTRYSVFQTDT